MYKEDNPGVPIFTANLGVVSFFYLPSLQMDDSVSIYIIPHLHNLFLFQCDVTRSLNRYEARSKLFINQGRTTLYQLLRYIGQYRCNAVFT